MPECKNCSRDVSRKAKACPNCGEPDPAKGSALLGFIFWSFVIFFVLRMAAGN